MVQVNTPERKIVDNVPQTYTMSAVEPNVEPSPSFDIEINKEDKDADVENPDLKKDQNSDRKENEEDNKADSK